jgi:16S rRNA (guanine527-N7)-methyltransferase
VTANLRLWVDRVSTEMGVALEPRITDSIVRWLERLRTWNARIDLTAARSSAELVDLMLADAMFLAGRIDRGARVVDIGTGAGPPGLPLALLREDLKMTLVESNGKRTSFLRTAVGTAGRADIAILRQRAEDLPERTDWDVAISRATLAPQRWLAVAARLVVAGGQIWTLLAKDIPPHDPEVAIETDTAYRWPLTSADRRAVSYRLI